MTIDTWQLLECFLFVMVRGELPNYTAECSEARRCKFTITIIHRPLYPLQGDKAARYSRKLYLGLAVMLIVPRAPRARL